MSRRCRAFVRWCWSLAAAMSLACLSAPVAADQNDGRLEALFALLKTARSPSEAEVAERDIWRIWIDSGREDVDELMADGIRAMSAGHVEDSIEIFARIVELAPAFAEGWNKRATAYYLNDELPESVLDIRRTLALEPRHFGAISGMGLIFLRRGDESSALDAFEAVLEINPHARGALLRAEQLRERLLGQGV